MKIGRRAYLAKAALAAPRYDLVLEVVRALMGCVAGFRDLRHHRFQSIQPVVIREALDQQVALIEKSLPLRLTQDVAGNSKDFFRAHRPVPLGKTAKPLCHDRADKSRRGPPKKEGFRDAKNIPVARVASGIMRVAGQLASVRPRLFWGKI